MQNPTISETELSQFVRDGYFIRRNVFDSDTCRLFINRAWKELDAKGIDSSPGSWLGNDYLRQRKGVVKLRGEIASDETLQAAIHSNSTLNQIALELIGGSKVTPDFRGLYPTFPIPKLAARPYDAHIEEHPVQVFAMVYLNKVRPDNGAFCVWPGSHREVIGDFDTKFGFDPRPGFGERFEEINRDSPVEITGETGDVCFCHHRIIHAGSNNVREKVRWGILVDYLREDYESLATTAPGSDMWDYWGDSVRAASRLEAAPSVRPAGFTLRRSIVSLRYSMRRMRGRKPHSYAPQDK